MHDDSLSWLSTSTSIKSDRAKLVLWVQTITYNQANSVIIKNAIILNIIHNIFNLCDTEVVIGMLSILFKK